MEWKGDDKSKDTLSNRGRGHITHKSLEVYRRKVDFKKTKHILVRNASKRSSKNRSKPYIKKWINRSMIQI